MFYQLCCLIIAIQAQSEEIFGKNLILEPLEGKTGAEAAIIFFVGDKVNKEQYVDHLKLIQEKVSFPLWVGIPHIIDN